MEIDGIPGATPTAGAAQGFMDSLNEDAKQKLDHLVDGIQESHVTREDRSRHGTLIEYCLFASHADRTGDELGLPLVAHVALHETPFTFYSALLSRFLADSSVDRRSVCQIVCSYAQENRGKIPVTAFGLLLLPLTRRPQRTLMETACHADGIMTRVLLGGDVGDDARPSPWAHAGTLNRFGETQLSVLIRLNFSSEVLRSFMKAVPGAMDTVNARSVVDGATPAHLCVRLKMVDHLRVLLAHGADVQIKNEKGWTVLEYAQRRGKEDMAQIIYQAIWSSPAHAAQVASRSPLRPDTAASSLTRIYLPGIPDLSTSRVNKILFEYSRKHLPHLVCQDPSFIVVPPAAAAADSWAQQYCCRDEDTSSTRSVDRFATAGLQAELTVLWAVVDALEDFRRDKPTLHIACFHGLRYGARILRLGDWETDFDIAVLCCEEETDTQMVLLLEVKSITRGKDIVRNARPDGTEARTTGTKGLDQLCNHVGAIHGHVGVDSDPTWVIPVLAVPNLPPITHHQHRGAADGAVGEQRAKVQEVQGRLAAFLQRTAGSDQERLANYDRIKPRLLTGLDLKDAATFKTWLSDVYESVSRSRIPRPSARGVETSMTRSRRNDEYSTLLAWLLAHCVGVAVPEVSRELDDISARVLCGSVALLTVK